MGKVTDRETVIARLIFNTRRIKRPNNLVEIARDIRWLEKDLGSIKAVSNAINLSSEMLHRFLSVEKLCPRVAKLVNERKLDSLNNVLYMSNFNHNSQIAIADEVIKGKLTGEDVRALAPFHKKNPEIPISQLIKRFQNSKDKRVYVAYFRIPDLLKRGDKLIPKRLLKYLPKADLISFQIKNKIGILTLSSNGHKILREAVKKTNLSLRLFIDRLILGKI